MTWLREVAEVCELGVIGIGIGGSEQSYPPEPYERSTRRRGDLDSGLPPTPGKPRARKASGEPFAR